MSKKAVKKEENPFKRGENNPLPPDPHDLKDKHLQNLKPQDKQYDLTVGKGLILRVRPTGNISFRYAYHINGRARVVTVGSYPKNSLAVLRAKYQLMVDDVDSGKDVASAALAEKEAQRSEANKVRAEKRKKADALTVEKLAMLYLAHIEDPDSENSRGRPYSPQTVRGYKNHLLNHIIPKYRLEGGGSTLIEDVKRKDVKVWLKEKASGKNKAPSQANHLLTTFNAMLSWAVEEEMIDANQLAGIKKKPGGTYKPKTRALDYSPQLEKVIYKGEIATFWAGLEDVNPLHWEALRLVLMTGLRPGEVLGAEWWHIDDDEWVIPVENTKSKKSAHKIPMTADLKRMLKALRKITGETGYLFPQSRYEEDRLLKDGKKLKWTKDKGGNYKPVETSTVSKVLKGLELEPFSPHDLRRTVATHLKSMDFMKAEIGLLLHHSTADVTAIYALGDDMKRKLKLLNAWQRKLKQILSGQVASNVVPMK